MPFIIPSGSTLSLGSGFTQIGDYRLQYATFSIDLEVELKSIFPRIGYLMCNLAIGENLDCKYLNYSLESLIPNRLSISGLRSNVATQFSMKNQGLGYAFKVHPVIAYHFLKIPMTETIDRLVSVSDALQINGRILRELEKNEEIGSIDNMHLQHFLRESLPHKGAYLKDPIFHAVNFIMKQRGQVKIGKLAADFHMSERTLRRQFLQKVGLPPQAYARIWKMQNAIDCIRNNPSLSLEEVAWRTAYYDVAHLAHDFKNKVQMPPSKVKQGLTPFVEDYLDSGPISA